MKTVRVIAILGSFFLHLITGSILSSGLFLLWSEPVLAIEALPGSTWGNLPHSVQGLTGSGAAGWINQGIDWTTLPGGITLNTHAEFRYRARKEQKEYYNSEGPAIGLEFKKSLFRLGVDYFWEKLPEWPGGVQRSHNREVYLTGFYGWDLYNVNNPNLSGMAGFPGSAWFDLSYDINGLTGSSAMGFVNQGIDWMTLPGGITFNTYAEYRYRGRTKQNQYYNAEGLVIGLEFKKTPFRLGMDYYWERFPKLGERSPSLEYYLTWYIDWDLKQVNK